MKKHCLLFLVFVMSASLFACQTTTTTAFPNPSPADCRLTSNGQAYLCGEVWTSYFDTLIQLNLYYRATDTYDIATVFQAAESRILEYHQLLDKYNAYENVVNVYSINQTANVLDTNSTTYGTVTISQNLYDAFQTALDHDSDILDDGELLFDITLEPVLRVWHDARESASCTTSQINGSLICPVPNASLLVGPFNINPSDILLDPIQKTIGFAKPNMGVDLGGFGKGYMAEIVTDYLDTLNISYLLNAGNSNIKAGELNPSRPDGHYYVALTTPIVNQTTELPPYYGYLKLPEGMSVITSGNYQRYFIGESDGLIYHHIIDPRTYYPGGETMSVSVMFEDGGLGDLYSTSLFLLSIEAGLAYVNQTPGLEAIWYLTDGSVVFSNGLVEGTLDLGNGTTGALYSYIE